MVAHLVFHHILMRVKTVLLVTCCPLLLAPLTVHVVSEHPCSIVLQLNILLPPPPPFVLLRMHALRRCLASNTTGRLRRQRGGGGCGSTAWYRTKKHLPYGVNGMHMTCVHVCNDRNHSYNCL